VDVIDGGSALEPPIDSGDGTGPRRVVAQASGQHPSRLVNEAADTSTDVGAKHAGQKKGGNDADDAAAHSGWLKGNVYARAQRRKRVVVRGKKPDQHGDSSPDDDDDFMDLLRSPAAVGRRYPPTISPSAGP